MGSALDRGLEDRVLVLLPSVRDGERTASLLCGEGLHCVLCHDLGHLCREVEAGAGVVLLTEGEVGAGGADCLSRALRGQPPWSALPLVILTPEHGASQRDLLDSITPNVTLVERPVRMRTLLSVVRSALRARRHQYQIRDSLVAQGRQTVALRQSEARLELALSIAQLGTFDIDLRTDEVWVNERGREIYGWPAGEGLTFARVQESFHPEDRGWVAERVARAMAPEGEGRFELEQRIIRGDGRERWLRVQGLAIRGDGAGTPATRCVGTFLDISEARRAQDELRASEARFRTLVEQVKEYAIFSTDTRGRAQTWNEGVERVLGYSEAEFVGLDVVALFTPEDREERVPEVEFAEAVRTGSGNNDRWLLRRDGRRFWAMGMTTALRGPSGELLGFSKVIRDQTDWKVAQEELARHRDHLDDLVKERTAELETSMARLRSAERMASLGTLSAGLGHDMGNLLLPVRMRLDVLEGATLTDSMREDVAAIRTATEYLQRLANGLRHLAMDAEREEVVGGAGSELGAWWKDASAVMRNVLPRGIELRSRLPEGACWVGMARPGLTQAVFNLVQNAGDAMRERGFGTVTVWAEEGEGDGEVTVGVSDDGPGMPAEVVRRCMEPFFTTKTRGLSTGLGMALAYGLVRKAGGEMEVRSSPGAGTTVLLRLPGASGPGEGDGAPPRVAVVDVADQRLRSFIEGELTSLAYRVRFAGAGEEDVALLVVDGAPARGLRPGVAVVLLGEAEAGSTNGGVVAIGRAPKPRALREALRQVSGRVGGAGRV